MKSEDLPSYLSSDRSQPPQAPLPAPSQSVLASLRSLPCTPTKPGPHSAGSPQDKVLRMMYVWALCRDQEELNPYAAWRLLDISASSTEQIL